VSDPARGRQTSERIAVLHARAVVGAGGGPDKTILASPRYAASTRYWLGAAYLHPPSDPGFGLLRQRAAEAGCPLLELPDRWPVDPIVLPRLLAACRQRRVAIWHGHDYKSNLLGLLLRRLHPMRVVASVHGWVQITSRTRLYYALERNLLRRFDHVFAVDRDLLNQVAAAGVPPERRSLLLNGVEADHFCRSAPAAAASLRRQLGTPADRLVIGGLGRLSEEKGFDLLLEAAALVRDEGLRFELWIAGEGPEEPRLRAMLAGLDLDERVRLLGYQRDARTFLEALDVFVLSSRREGLPNALLEALAMEVPAAAAAVGGVPELIRDEETGLLIRPGDSAVLAAALHRLLSSAELRQRLARAGRGLIERDFSFATRTHQELALYDRLLRAPALIAPG
jgi:glycosyltransferase involved in cell wall biosynthesis